MGNGNSSQFMSRLVEKGGAMKKYVWCALGLVLLLFPGDAFATKECPPRPCMEQGKFDRKICEEQADWIVLGRIVDVEHDRQGPPLGKDFAGFKLVVDKCEKGCPQPPEFSFKVGWCYNQQELPGNPVGLFRFYGLKAKEPLHGGSQYMYFERAGE